MFCAILVHRHRFLVLVDDWRERPKDCRMTSSGPLQVDAVIFGGGGAGLWLLDELIAGGYSVLLVEVDELGKGQTIASQGIIHGGLKYTLSGLLTPSATAVSEMPGRWRASLAGERTPNLTKTRLRSEFCYLWQTSSLMSKLGMVGARAGLRVTPKKLEMHERPEILRDCPGVVARLDEQVIDTASFVTDLATQHREHILKVDPDYGYDFQLSGSGEVEVVKLVNSDTQEELEIHPKYVIFTAGSGNAQLRKLAGLQSELMQLRPLHMVMLCGDMPQLNGHCVDGASTRVTITSAEDSNGNTIWQIGGQLAEDGVALDEQALIKQAKEELLTVLPNLDLTICKWASYKSERAEATAAGKRPEDVCIIKDGNVITAWPTKLALAPRLSEQIAAMLDEPDKEDFEYLLQVKDWPKPVTALPPWETAAQWFTEV